MRDRLKQVLIVTDVNFWAKGAGHRMRIGALVQYLSSRVNLAIAFVGPMDAETEHTLSEALQARVFALEKSKVLSSKGYGRLLASLLKNNSFEAIIIEYIHNTYFLNYIPDGIKVILDAHDIVSNRTEQFNRFNYGGMSFEMSRETEFKIFDVYDYVMVLSDPDYKEIAASIGANKALLCPHHVTQIKRRVKREVKTIAFVASEYLPNVDAINFFLKHSWPAIYQKYNVCLRIYGGINKVFDFSNNEGVIAKGYVAELSTIYDEADIIINPVRFGAGLKIKTVEALSFGIPLVTTSHGATGLNALRNEAFFVADEPVEFTRAIGMLIESYQLRRRFSKLGHKFIEANFSEEKCYTPLLNIILKCNNND